MLSPRSWMASRYRRWLQLPDRRFPNDAPILGRQLEQTTHYTMAGRNRFKPWVVKTLNTLRLKHCKINTWIIATSWLCWIILQHIWVFLSVTSLLPWLYHNPSFTTTWSFCFHPHDQNPCLAQGILINPWARRDVGQPRMVPNSNGPFGTEE